MREMIRFLARLMRDQRAVSSVEYALLLALISVGLISTVGNIGSEIAEPLFTAANTILQ